MRPEELGSNAVEASQLLKSMSNEKRLLILCHLVESEMSVGALEKIVDLSQSALSQHLARLRHAGFVKTRRDAQTIYYSLESEEVKQVMGILHHIYCT